MRQVDILWIVPQKNSQNGKGKTLLVSVKSQEAGRSPPGQHSQKYLISGGIPKKPVAEG